MRFFSILLSFATALTLGNASAQSALVQFIHNSGDAELESIDIYAGDELIVSGLNFHHASPYIEVQGDVETDWHIAPAGSANSSEAVATFTQIFTADQSAVAVFNGLISTSGYSPIQPLDMDVRQNTHFNSNGANEVDLLFVHGITDLPTISLNAFEEASPWLSGLYFGQFSTDYVTVLEEDWLIDMRDLSNNVIEQFELLLQDYDLAGGAATAVLSGFNQPENNYLGEYMSIWLATADGGAMLECPAYIPPQYTKAQFIHASADPAMQMVDIYLNGDLLLDDFSFLTATAFIDVEALNVNELLIAPANSLSAEEAIASLPFYLNLESNYVLTIQGNLQGDGFSPLEPLQLNAFEGALINGLSGVATNVLFVNAATDLPATDIYEAELLQLDFTTDWSYGMNAGYFEILTADYIFALNNPANGETWASFGLPLTSYLLGSDAVTVVACGYTNSAANAQGPSLGMYAALYAGGPLIPLTAIQTLPKAAVQFINNSPDPLMEMVDVYVNGAKWVDDLPYLNATAFIDLPLLSEVTITVTPSDAVDADTGSSWTLDWNENERYVLTLNGMLDGQNFEPNLPLSLSMQSNVPASVADGQTAFYMVNGATDGPSFYTNLAANGSLIVEELSYDESSNAFATVNTTDFVIDLVVAGNDELFQSFGCPFESWMLQGQAITMVVGGFNNPANNNDGLAFGIWVAAAEGGPMMPLPVEIIPVFEARAQFIHNSADLELSVIDLYMNGNLIANDWSFRNATAFMDVPAEVPVTFAFAPATSEGPADAVVFLQKTFSANQTYYAIAMGMLDEVNYNPNQPFNLSILPNAQEQSLNTNQTDIIFHHGSTDLPGIDASEITEPMPGVLDNLMYDGLGGYLALDAASDYAFNFSVNNGNSLGDYAFPVNGMELSDQSILIFATGFLNPNNNNDGEPLKFYAALPNGTSFALDQYVEVLEQSLVEDLQVFPNPVYDQLNMMLKMSQAQNLDLELIDINGKVVFLERNLQTGNAIAKSIDVSNLPEGYYFLRVQNRQLVKTIGFGIIR